MTYSEACEYIKTVSTPGSVYGLERIRNLLHELGDPQERLKFIHVAGTNGKGSVSRMLAGILKEAGYKVGCFNSPCLSSPREYLNVNLQDASEEAFAESVERIREALSGVQDSLRPTAFEIYTAMAIDYFARTNCDPVILECGMGGLTDSTNVIGSPIVAVITRIGLDHVPALGRNIREITAQKAGIIKKGCTVLCYPSEDEALEVIKDKVADVYGPEWKDRYRVADTGKLTVLQESLVEGDVITYGEYSQLHLGLKGRFQSLNTATVLEVVEALIENGYSIDLHDIRTGLLKASWPARFEIVSGDPLIILDGGHNTQCMDALCESLDALLAQSCIPDRKRFILVTGVMSDKSYNEIFERLSRYAGLVIATEPDNDRRLEADSIRSFFDGYGVESLIVAKPSQAVEKAVSLIKQKGNADRFCGVLVTGSLYMMGEVRDTLLNSRK